jgi:hypothetical protein
MFAVAAIGMLTMPVEYRAGAEVPHYHIFFQLWIDASHASFRHHEPAHDHANGLVQPGASVANGYTSVSDDPDAPQLSTMTAPETRWAILIALGGLIITLVVGRKRLPPALPRSLTGRLLGPDPPPPRPAD